MWTAASTTSSDAFVSDQPLLPLGVEPAATPSSPAAAVSPRDSFRAFQQLRERWSTNSGLGLEVLRAMHEIINRYDVSDRANRFVVGHYMEAVLAATFYGADLIAPPAGANADGFDLRGITAHFHDVMSVKCSFTPGQGFRITNGMNGPGRGWTDPTLFISPSLPGIVYASPAEHPDLAALVRQVSDATTLNLTALREHVRRHPECVIPIVVPANPRTGRGSLGADVFRQIVGDSPGMYPELSRVMVRARIASEGGDMMEQVAQLLDWERGGRITAAQREDMVGRLIGR